MISAIECKIFSLINVEEYCTKHIEPLLIKNGGNIIYGKYNEDGSEKYHISSLYAKDPPALYSLGTPEVHPALIKTFLESLGYEVKWVKIKEPYSAGYSSSKRTKYYNAGYNTYYSLEISC